MLDGEMNSEPYHVTMDESRATNLMLTAWGGIPVSIE
jgi:hypothetical protein